MLFVFRPDARHCIDLIVTLLTWLIVYRPYTLPCSPFLYISLLVYLIFLYLWTYMFASLEAVYLYALLPPCGATCTLVCIPSTPTC